MTGIVDKTKVTISEDAHTLGGEFENVTDVRIFHGVLEFSVKSDTETSYIRTNRPFSVITTRTLSCGHKFSSYYEEDGGNAGVWPHCKECEIAEGKNS